MQHCLSRYVTLPNNILPLPYIHSYALTSRTLTIYLSNQVTSRAHRLGATGPVCIETVNVWHELDSSTKAFQKRISSNLDDEEKRQTSRAVCEYCYRSFDNIILAEKHEIRCDRNPESCAEVNLFHLSSVYRDLRPPSPLMIGASDE